MTRDDLIERLAAIEHERWADWQEHQNIKSTYIDMLDADGFVAGENRVCFTTEQWDHWQVLRHTPYADLPEHSKQSDREQVMRYWPLIVLFVHDWLEAKGDPDYLVDEWMGEMGDKSVMAALRDLDERF